MLAMELKGIWPDADYEMLNTSDKEQLEIWMQERRINERYLTTRQQEGADGSGLLIAGSVEEIETELSLREGIWRDDCSDAADKAEMDLRAGQDRMILSRIRSRTHFYLCRCEAEMALGSAAANVFDRHRSRVDATLIALAPDVLEQFSAAYRRSRDGDSESRAHALTSCRRILKAVADIAFPPRTEPLVDGNGRERKVGPGEYKNRILAFVDEAPRQTAASVIAATFADFDRRLTALNELDSKGVHADVTQSEVDLCVVQTYLLAGELLTVHAEVPPA